ncbi:MAG: C40 family peptidase [Chitinophagaceae bacterium]|nr:C40 family peptidase [Chitinophagaceae bacterium]
MIRSLALTALLLLTGITNFLSAQTSVKSFKTPLNFEKLSAITFIDNISFVPAGSFSFSEKASPVDTKKTRTASASVPEEAIEKISTLHFKYAMLMDVAVESLKSITLYSFIEEWYGTRYRMGGTTKKGIDCSAFTGSLLLAVYTLAVPRTAREQYHACEHIQRENLLEGDLVFFNTRGGVSHVGVYLANKCFVHSCSSQGVMISNLDDEYYAKRFIGGGRIN